MKPASKKMVVIAIVKTPKSRNCSSDLAIGAPIEINQIEKMTAMATIRISHPIKSPLQPVHDFFQMLLGSSFINSVFGGTQCRRPKLDKWDGDTPSLPIYVIKISTRSLRGNGKNLGGTASRAWLTPINSASIHCCCFNSAITSSDGGAAFSAITGVVSRAEKSKQKIRIQTAARPAQALG